MDSSTQVADAIAVVVTPYFNAMATGAFLDPFRAANYLSNAALYSWDWYSSIGGMIKASNGLQINTLALHDVDDKPPYMGVVSSSWTPETHYADRPLAMRVRAWARDEALLCGIDTGAFILANAGVLDGRVATVHYEHIDTFQEIHPEVQCSEQLYVMDGNMLSTAGGEAGIDLALQLIRMRHGDNLANASARYIFHDRLRQVEENQNNAGFEPVVRQAVPERLRAAILLMEQHLEEPLQVSEIARRVSMSQRQLIRLFKQYTQRSIVKYYHDIRLDRGRTLVTQTELSLLEVAIACGFGSASYFSRAYHDRFGIPPSKDRVSGRVPFEYRAWPMHPQG